MCYKVRTYHSKQTLQQTHPYYCRAGFPKWSSTNSWNVTRGKTALKSGIFCQYWLGVLSPALSQTSRRQWVKRERLGTRLQWHVFLPLYWQTAVTVNTANFVDQGAAWCVLEGHFYCSVFASFTFACYGWLVVTRSQLFLSLFSLTT